MAAISYDSVDILKSFADRKKIEFPMLADTDSKTIRAYEVLNSFHIGHDASDQGSGAIAIEKRDGQTADMLLHPHAQICDKVFAGNRKPLREDVRGNCLDEGSRGNGAHDQRQLLDLVLVHYIIDEITRRNGDGQTADAIHDHQQTAACKKPPEWLDELPNLRHDPSLLGDWR